MPNWQSVYVELQRRLGAYPVDDFVRTYFKAYLEADLETIKKLQELLLADLPDFAGPRDYGRPDSPVGAPVQPSPHFNPGAMARPEPTGHDA
jgi:hypothetical protein